MNRTSSVLRTGRHLDIGLGRAAVDRLAQPYSSDTWWPMRKIGTTRYSYSLTVLSRKVISRHVPIVENYRDTRKVPKPIKHGEDASLVFVFSMTRFACSSSTYGRMGRPDNIIPGNYLVTSFTKTTGTWSTRPRPFQSQPDSPTCKVKEATVGRTSAEPTRRCYHAKAIVGVTRVRPCRSALGRPPMQSVQTQTSSRRCSLPHIIFRRLPLLGDATMQQPSTTAQ